MLLKKPLPMVFRNMRFSQRLFLCIFTLSFLLLAVGLMLLYQTSASAVTAINNGMMESTISVTGNNLEQTFDNVDSAVEFAFQQQNVLSSLQQTDGADTAPTAYSIIRHALITAVASSKVVHGLGLYDNEDMRIQTYAAKKLPYSDYDECVEHLSSVSCFSDQGSQAWYFLQTDPTREDRSCIYNVREIWPLTSNTDREILLIAIVTEPKISEVYEYLGPDSCLVTPDGTVVSAVDKERLGSTISSDILESVHASKAACSFRLDGDDKFYYSVYIPSADVYLLSNSGSQILHNANHTITVTVFLLIGVGMLFSLMWANFTTKALTGNLVQLKTSMEQARAGDFRVRCNVCNDDEIGYLSATFNHMMDSLCQYVEELRGQQRLTRESDLRLLQAQINPHLLYNTLDSALYLMTTNDTQRAIAILEEMSEFFKLSLQSGHKIVTIEEELQHAASYLKLQHLSRLKDFNLTIHGDPLLRQATILHMLLQPIVENAVLHGFDGNFADGTIDISLFRGGNSILLQITDDGIGMDEQTLTVLQTNIAAALPPESGFALWNINQRIKGYYGDAYGMKIESEWGEYSKVTLMIPYRPKDTLEGADDVSIHDC